MTSSSSSWCDSPHLQDAWGWGKWSQSWNLSTTPWSLWQQLPIYADIVRAKQQCGGKRPERNTRVRLRYCCSESQNFATVKSMSLNRAAKIPKSLAGLQSHSKQYKEGSYRNAVNSGSESEDELWSLEYRAQFSNAPLWIMLRRSTPDESIIQALGKSSMDVIAHMSHTGTASICWQHYWLCKIWLASNLLNQNSSIKLGIYSKNLLGGTLWENPCHFKHNFRLWGIGEQTPVFHWNPSRQGELASKRNSSA